MSLGGRHTDHVSCVAFSPDGKRIASGGGDKTVRVWAAATGKELAALRGHAGRVMGAVVSPDGNSCLSWSTGVGEGFDGYLRKTVLPLLREWDERI